MTAFDRPVIIGTGPSAIACADALIKRGLHPILIDGGLTAGAPARGDSGHARSNPGEKLWFGSSFATDDHPGAQLTYDPGLVARPSYAVGGLSRVWGGTFSFFRNLDHWPADSRPEQGDLTAVSTLIPHARTDFAGPQERGPGPGSIAGSAASAKAMRAFRAVAGDRWNAEHATVAIDTRNESASKCQLLGTCLDGCSVDSIWYAGDQLRRWVAESRVTHLAGEVVDRLSESAGAVNLTLSDGTTSQSVTAPRVYVAAGGIGTGALLVRSGLRNEVVLRDTATAFAGIFDLRRSSGNERPHHGLSQWWARNLDGGFLAQMYPPDPSNSRRLAARLPSWAEIPAVLSWLAARLHPVVAYLSSADSDTIRIAMAGSAPHVYVQHSAESRRVMRAQLRRFSRALLQARYLLPVAAAELSAPGTGYHFGASLRHGSETDSLGRLAGLHRIHIVDASVLPSLELGSITPTVMANAFRIGRQTSLQTAGA